MTEKVSTMDVRARIGDMLNRVALRHDEFVIERKGKPLAALVPVERLEQMRRGAYRPSVTAHSVPSPRVLKSHAKRQTHARTACPIVSRPNFG